MNYKKFLRIFKPIFIWLRLFFGAVFKTFKPTKKKIFIWLGLFFGIEYIAYLFSPLDGPPSFGFPFPFYHFGGHTMTGVYLPSKFDIFFLIIDVIFWYIISCLFE
ncbi:MAG: hypothetical protein QW755_06420 [Nitrososphaerota archaeon]